jgi:opacity protein-like surface antigen
MKNTLLAVSLSTSMLLLVPITVSADIKAQSFLQLGGSTMNFDQSNSENNSYDNSYDNSYHNSYDNNNDSSFDLQGHHVKGNIALSDSTYLSYERSATSTGGVGLEIKDIGVGYQSALSPSAAVFIQLDKTYYDVDSDYRRFDNSETGYRASIGVRKLLTDSVAVNASYQYLYIGERASNIFALGASYSFSDTFSLHADYKGEQYYDHVSVGLRMTF